MFCYLIIIFDFCNYLSRLYLSLFYFFFIFLFDMIFVSFWFEFIYLYWSFLFLFHIFLFLFDMNFISFWIEFISFLFVLFRFHIFLFLVDMNFIFSSVLHIRAGRNHHVYLMYCTTYVQRVQFYYSANTVNLWIRQYMDFPAAHNVLGDHRYRLLVGNQYL